MTKVKIKPEKLYTLTQIDKYAFDNKMFVSFYGVHLPGEEFILLKNSKSERIASFVLNASSATGTFYKCVFTNFK